MIKGIYEKPTANIVCVCVCVRARARARALSHSVVSDFLQPYGL